MDRELFNKLYQEGAIREIRVTSVEYQKAPDDHKGQQNPEKYDYLLYDYLDDKDDFKLVLIGRISKNIQTIKNIAIAFLVLTIIGIVSSVIILL